MIMVEIDQDDIIVYGGVIGIAVLVYLLIEYFQKEKSVMIGAAMSAPIHKECGE